MIVKNPRILTVLRSAKVSVQRASDGLEAGGDSTAIERMLVDRGREALSVEVRGDGDRKAVVLEFDTEDCLADLLLDCWDAMSPRGRTSVLEQMRNEAGQKPASPSEHSGG